MTDVTGYVDLALLVGVIGVVVSLLGTVERITRALEQLAARRDGREGAGGPPR